ncbi:glycoside hydrolase superfamily [Aspergillus unguis]
MHLSQTILSLSLATSALSLPSHVSQHQSFNWTTEKRTGVNLGGWLVQEKSLDNTWWNTYGPDAADEWDICQTLGPAKCSSVLEHRYATYITTDLIDTFASAGVNILRIPSTYAAWIDLPGSGLYSGNQTTYLRKITEHAITKYDMHIVLDVHSLPGGLNGLEIGEKVGNWGWFYNATAWAHSLEVMDQVLEFVASSSSPGSFTLEPMNEPADRNKESDLGMSVFGTPEALSDKAAAYVLEFWKAVLKKVRGFERERDLGVSIPVGFQSFKLPSYWKGNFTSGDNVLFDMHNYYFEGRNTTSQNVPKFMLEDAKLKSAGAGGVPVFIGEWAVQTASGNELKLRERNVKAGISLWEEYMQGSAYWSGRYLGNATVVGEGVTKNYWDFEEFVELGFFD